ncbi:GNAT family N-acetyltransferase [Oceanobacillus sp. FSL W8-0428]|uniref:N-acetyltransferase domain-containing protein n=1 Tax=Oceanobacillus sojae TaxID=582851 RepID=A0A511ZJE2_9BACI|nr:GNAT family N-acetyltransferase [Oceanobacillus sojae]GEN87547.1 hypothetical protein OSO01_22860 [Oceanobacillus sojae]
MEVKIEKAATEHAKEIAAICSSGWRQTVAGKFSQDYQDKNVTKWYTPERIKQDIEIGSYTHTAIIDSKVAGVIGGKVMDSGVSRLFVLYVDEKYRYQGIGKQLLEIFTKEHKEQGATEQWVSVQDDNQRGIPFYEARGFMLREKRNGMTDTGEAFVNLQYSRSI